MYMFRPIFRIKKQKNSNDLMGGECLTTLGKEFGLFKVGSILNF